ncbi:ergothioneine biosynthesis glutamate--cysteine ligase EgtA [Microlunatus soli]|uniref:Glutamate--cysteine ligase EgtA n=1 Tax=Microlunatus soli TaxID=630515 RepID=A0A1H1NE32_9ACTN|nr:ergothioneine biosynthesis glutamate--cysteine ligase EgtA [Microlunatus soli]SDR97070.1 glutamate--cysteine ligase [Microlunatus soli]
MATVIPIVDQPLPAAAPLDSIETARRWVESTALTDSVVGPVGLELEAHLIDTADRRRRPEWEEITDLVDGLPPMSGGSKVTVEPGGQLELSTPPLDGAVTAIRALQADRRTLTAALAVRGLAAVPLGADPLRPPRRVSPGPRYAAMEEHFRAVGSGAAGTAMMTATAALQINLEAGPRAGWPARFRLITALAPLLIAVSAASPALGGRRSGWSSMRQQAWSGLDPRRSGPVPADDHPAAAWADYALAAPVMQIRDDDRIRAVTDRIPFSGWVEGAGPVDRPPTRSDLDHHLSTLFPPIRPRGYLELRCLDAVGDRWWPGLAAFVVTLIDVPAAAASAARQLAPVRGRWHQAARYGLADPPLARAARGCAEIAVRHAPDELRAEFREFCDLIIAGRSPAGDFAARVERDGPAAALEEEIHA